MKKIIYSLYFVFLILFTIFSYAFIDPNIAYLKKIYTGLAFSNRDIASLAYCISIFIFFIFYFFFLKLIKENRIDIKELIFLIVGGNVILFLAYPAMLSYDIFNYIATAKVSFLYKENPYIIMPIEFSGDSILAFMRAANKTSLYGPFWIILTSIPYYLGFGNFLATLFSFKLFVSFFYLLTCLISYKITKSSFSLGLVALNPLILIESLVSGHNDIVMMFFALFSFYFLLKKKSVKAYFFLFLSFLIKFATFVLLPIYLAFKKVKKENLYPLLFILLFLIFTLSSFREEIYPWYAIWFLIFVFLNPKHKLILWISLTFSFSLLFRYVPYMLYGTYSGITPFLRSAVSFLPPALILVYFFLIKFARKK